MAVDSGLKSGSGWAAVCGGFWIWSGEHFEWSKRVNRRYIERDRFFF
jgi:hypothetical protein